MGRLHGLHGALQRGDALVTRTDFGPQLLGGNGITFARNGVAGDFYVARKLCGQFVRLRFEVFFKASDGCLQRLGRAARRACVCMG